MVKDKLKPKVEVLAHMGPNEQANYKYLVKYVNKGIISRTIWYSVTTVIIILFWIKIIMRQRENFPSLFFSALAIWGCYALANKKQREALEEIEEIENVKKYKMKEARPKFDEGDWRPSKRKEKKEITLKIES